MVSCQEPSPLKGSKHSSQCHPHDAALVNELSLCPWGWRQGVARPKRCTLPPHEEATLPSWLPSPWPSPLQLPLPSLTLTPLPSPSPSLLPLQSPIAVATAVGHCCSHREPLPPPSLLRCCQPSLLPLPLPSDIAVSIIVGHHSFHCCWPLLSPCRRPFPRVVALGQQKLYSTN